MGNLFKDLTAGFSSFVLAWLVPAAVVVTLFAALIYPELTSNGEPSWTRPIGAFASTGALAATAAFGLAVVTTALVTALASRPLYRVLEGYTLPKGLTTRLIRRQLLNRRRLERSTKRRRLRPHERAIAREHLALYPTATTKLLPTRLGNALRALETYAGARFRLDSQTLWYELYAAAPEQTRRDQDNARAAVDFFVSLVGLLGILSLAGFGGALWVGSWQCLVVATLSLVGARLAYSAAVTNMTDLRYAVQAVVNLSRTDLAKQLGYQLPATLVEEQALWRSWTVFVARDQHSRLGAMDHLRLPAGQPPDPTGGRSGSDDS